MANAHSAVASWGSVRFAFIQQLCSVPLSPSRYPHPAPVQLALDAHASMHAPMLVTLTLPTSVAWSPEKSIPQYCRNCFEPASEVYSVLLDAGQVMLDLVSGVADAEAEDDVPVGVEVGRAVTKTVVAAGLHGVSASHAHPGGLGYPAGIRFCKTHDPVALMRSASALRRFLWLTPSPALSPITAAMRMRSAAIRAKHELRFTPDDAGGADEYAAGGGAWP